MEIVKECFHLLNLMRNKIAGGMMKKKKHNGFTLIEIVVVLTISTIALSMAGSLVVFSMKMGAEGTSENQEKQIVDALVSVFEEELSNATAIAYSEDGSEPSSLLKDGSTPEWHYYTVTDSGTIQRDGSEVYSESFYQGNKIELMLTIQENSVLLRIVSSDYEQTAVISLDNVKSNFTITTLEETSIQGDARLYYATTRSEVASVTEEEEETEDAQPDVSEEEEVDPDEDPRGTIEDYVVSGSSNYGGFQNIIDASQSNTYILKGALVFNKNDGYWYQVIQSAWITEDIFSNNSGAVVRRIDPYFTTSSAYLKGDVILYEYNGSVNYYRCLQNVLYGWPVPDGDYNSSNYWQKLDSAPEGALQTTIEYDEGGDAMATVADTLEDDAATSYVGEYDASKKYEVGDMVCITYEAKYGKPYREFYMKINDYDVKPGETTSSNQVAWKLYSKLYSSTSAYKAGDVVGIIMDGRVRYFRFLRDCDKSYSRTQIYYNAPYSYFEGGQLIEFLN